MKFFSGLFSLPASWDDVVFALCRRYPNPYSKHVLSEDVIDRYVCEGKLYTIKLLTKTNHLPRWGERFYHGPNFVCIVEESVIDPQAKTVTTYTRNVSLGKLLSVTEKCVYSQHGGGATSVAKSAWLDSSIGYGLSKPILEFALQRYKANQRKALLGLEHVLSNAQTPTLSSLVKHSREKLSETKEMISQKAKKASELAMLKAEHAKSKGQVQAAEV